MSSAPEVSLELLLKRAEALVQAASGLSLALADIGIELPPVNSGLVDKAQLQAVATLYLTSELEAAGVLKAVETLTRLARSGGLSIDVGDAAPLLQEFWQGRNERVSEAERMGFFSALFGAVSGPDHAEHSRNDEFEPLLLDLCEALYKMDEQANNSRWGGVAQQTRIRAAAQRLLVNLVRITSGITVFMAGEILSAFKAALAILRHPAIKAAFHARTPWEVVAAIERMAGQPDRNFEIHVRRGQAGMTLLAWLAEAASLLDRNEPLVGLDHPVITAAVDWLQASLSLTEEEISPTGGEPSPGTKSVQTASPWSVLVG